MKRYPEYKESGVEGIGEIPVHWEISKIKHVATFVSQKSTPETDAIKISPENVESETGKVLDFYSPYDSVGVKFQAGDVLFNKLRVYLSKVVFAEYSGYSLGEMIVVRPSLQDTGKYIYYLMLSPRFIEYCDSISYGVKMPRTSVDDILNARIPLASYQEQTQIVNFLDRKTKQIDELIRIKARRVELLQEQRTALIHETVTKGLDPNVEMKPSGVEYIGDIPKHWTITRLKYVSNIPVTYGLNIEPDKYTTNGIRFIRITDIDESGRLRENGVYLSESDVSQKQILNRYDLLLCRSGATVGKSYLHLEKGQYASAGYLVRFNFGDYCTSKFIYYVTQSHFYRNWLEPQIIIATIQNVNGEKYSKFQIPFPLPQERTQIVNFLDHKTAKIDELRFNEQRSIELLKEYRQTLISEVVTGKIDVRAVSAESTYTERNHISLGTIVHKEA